MRPSIAPRAIPPFLYCSRRGSYDPDTFGIGTLPKVLRLLGLSTASRAAPALDGLEIVQLCLYAELPLSAVMDAEEDQ